MTTPLVLVGCGGHGRVVLDLLTSLTAYDIVGIVDPRLTAGSSVGGVRVLGGDGVLPRLRAAGVTHAAVGVGSICDNRPRTALAARLRAIGFLLPSLMHPTAALARDVTLGDGTVCMAGAIAQAGARLGRDVIVNTGAQVDHDGVIGDGAHVSIGAVIGGACTVGDGAFIGAGATVIQGIRIGAHAIVAAGAVVIRDVPEGAMVMGVPAQVRTGDRVTV